MKEYYKNEIKLFGITIYKRERVTENRAEEILKEFLTKK